MSDADGNATKRKSPPTPQRDNANEESKRLRVGRGDESTPGARHRPSEVSLGFMVSNEVGMKVYCVPAAWKLLYDAGTATERIPLGNLKSRIGHIKAHDDYEWVGCEEWSYMVKTFGCDEAFPLETELACFIDIEGNKTVKPCFNEVSISVRIQGHAPRQISFPRNTTFEEFTSKICGAPEFKPPPISKYMFCTKERGVERPINVASQTTLGEFLRGDNIIVVARLATNSGLPFPKSGTAVEPRVPPPSKGQPNSFPRIGQSGESKHEQEIDVQVKLVEDAPVASEDVTAPSRQYSIVEKLQLVSNVGNNIEGEAGVTGLSNLGNTCFMNAAIQCLSHCEAIQAFFCRSGWHVSLNSDNRMGFGGNFAKSVGSLIEMLWSGQHRVIVPRQLKALITEYWPGYDGNGQHDAHELLCFVLDSLHEDLKETVGGASVIYQNFRGQLKSRVRCTNIGCTESNEKIESFTSVSLPIVAKQVDFLYVLFQPVDYEREPHYVPVAISPELTSVGSLLYAIWEATKHFQSEPENLRLAAINKNGRFFGIYENDLQLESLENEQRLALVCYDIGPRKTYQTEGVIRAFHMYPDGRNLKCFGFPLLFRGGTSVEHMSRVMLCNAKRWVIDSATTFSMSPNAEFREDVLLYQWHLRQYYKYKRELVKGRLLQKHGAKGSRIKLEDCIDQFITSERLTGADAWYCPSCEKKTDATKTVSLFELPDTLVVQIKRFHVEGMTRRKITDVVEFPISGLDMRRHIDLKEGPPLLYDLIGVVNHSGTLGSGHYTAFVKRNHGEEEQWLEFNDRHVSKVVSSPDSMVTARAYILFYKKRVLRFTHN